MKNIISAFTTLFFYLLCVFGAAALLTASAQTAAAKEYKADVIAEIENSDFNRDVISSCISQAQSAGYTLTVTPSANAELMSFPRFHRLFPHNCLLWNLGNPAASD